MKPEIVLPTPERMAKGDLSSYKETGRSFNTTGYDLAYKRGIIDSNGWRACNLMRLGHNAATRHLAAKTSRYSDVLIAGSVEDFLNDHITLSDQYNDILRKMEHSELVIVRAVACYDMSMRDASRHLGKRYSDSKAIFDNGVEWLVKHFNLGGKR